MGCLTVLGMLLLTLWLSFCVACVLYQTYVLAEYVVRWANGG